MSEGVAHALRVEIANHAPDFIAFSVEIDEGGGEFKIVYGCKFHADFFLNVQANDKDCIADFLFELVHDGLYRYTAYSIGGLEFEQDGFACSDHRLHLFGIIHKRCLTRMEDRPGDHEPQNDHTKGKVIVPFGLIGE